MTPNSNMNLTITLTPELRLEQALQNAGVEDPSTITNLTITGQLTRGLDFKYIRKRMRKTLQKLDLSGVSINGNKIGNWSFGGCIALESIIIPKTVKKIDTKAFWGTPDITTILVHPDNPVFTSENGVLLSKDKATLIAYPSGRQGNYVIPNSITEIGAGAFGHCTDLTSIIFPNSVKHIGPAAFFACTGLASIIIPNSVEKIEAYAFMDCTKLSTVFISESVVEIGIRAFQDCPAFITVHPDNPVYASENGKLIEKNVRFDV